MRLTHWRPVRRSCMKRVAAISSPKIVWSGAMSTKAFSQADRIFEETFSSPSMFHHPMEPMGGFLAHYRQWRGEYLDSHQLTDSRCGGVRALSRHRAGQGSRARALRRRRLRLEDSDAGAFRGAVSLAQDRPSGALDSVGGRKFPAELAPRRSVQSQGRRQSRRHVDRPRCRSDRRHRRLHHGRRSPRCTIR